MRGRGDAVAYARWEIFPASFIIRNTAPTLCGFAESYFYAFLVPNEPSQTPPFLFCPHLHAACCY